jgi:hypothetical protein
MSKRMAKLAGFIFEKRLWVIIVSAVLLVLSLWSASGISMKTSLMDMLPESNPYAASYKGIMAKFGSASSLVLSVRGPNAESARAAAADLRLTLASDAEFMSRVKSLASGVDQGFIEANMAYLADDAAFSMLAGLLAQPGLLESARFLAFAADIAGSDGELDERVRALLETFEEGLSGGSREEAGRELAQALVEGAGRIESGDGRHILMMAVPAFSLEELEANMGLFERFDTLADQVESRHPGTMIGYAGDLGGEADERRAMSLDLMIPSLIAFGLILALFAFSFDRARSVLLMAASLVVGILWDLGLIGVTVGEVNMFTASFATLLVGLGIDFGIHVAINYEAARRAGSGPKEALEHSFETGGWGVMLGALTTALAFLGLAFFESKGLSQLGIVAGMGIVTCAAAMLFLFPALLAGFDRRDAARRLPSLRFEFLARIGAFAARRRGLVIAAATAFALAMGWLSAGATFEYDMSKVGPQESTAQRTQRAIIRDFGMSSYPSMIAVSSPDEARAIAERLRAEPLVGHVESPSDYLALPSTIEERKELVAALSAPEAPTDGWTRAKVLALAEALESLMACAEGREADPASKIRSDPEKAASALESMERAFMERKAELARAMRAAEPITDSAQLPEGLRLGTVADGELLVTFYPSDQVRGREGLDAYARRLREIAPGSTGLYEMGFTMMNDMLAEALWAAAVMLCLVALTVILDFKRLKPILAAMAVIAIGMAGTVGAYTALGFSFNMISILALPLVIGLGIDYTIHIVHALHGGGGIEAAMRGTGKAIFLSAATTMLGFGSLALMAGFAGIATLGWVLLLGIGAFTLASLLVLPALLSLGRKAG